MKDIKLYGYSTSPFVRKVGCYLYYKNLDFEFIPVNPTDPSIISFTSNTQVPVLSIGDEWRTESTDLGIWLDELFPEKPILGNSDSERDKILAIDQWISDRFITSMFRYAVDTPMSLAFRFRAWRLAAIVGSQSPLPDETKNAWPDGLKSAQFIQDMMRDVDRSESLKKLQYKLVIELIDRLEGGPFLGGLRQPSLADFSLYPQIVFGFMVGLSEDFPATTFKEVRSWLNNMRPLLPENPLLVPDYMIVGDLDHEITKGGGLSRVIIEKVGSTRFLKLLASVA